MCPTHPRGRRGAGSWGGGRGWEAGKGSAPSALQFVGAIRCNPNQMGCPHIKGMGAAPPGMGRSRRCRSALHRVCGTCGYPEEPLQCSPAPVQGCCCPSPLHPGLGYVGSNRGMEQALHSAWGSRPQLFRGLPARQRDVPAKLPPSPVPTVVTFWQPAEGALLQVFASQELTQSADYRGTFWRCS